MKDVSQILGPFNDKHGETSVAPSGLEGWEHVKCLEMTFRKTLKAILPSEETFNWRKKEHFLRITILADACVGT